MTSTHQPFNWRWVGISVVIFFIVQLVISLSFTIFGILTFGLGFILFILLKPLAYFIGGYITGALSPGITLKEPAVGAVIVSVIGTLFDALRISGGGVFWALLSTLAAYFLALWGARMGEAR